MSLVGFHVSSDAHGGLYYAITSGYQAGANAMQVCLSPPARTSPCAQLSGDEIEKITSFVREHSLYLVVHGKYIYNFCNGVTWQQTSLLDELSWAAKIGADVVIHQGKNTAKLGLTREQALRAFAYNLGQVLDRARQQKLTNRVILENSCQQGTECGYTVQELAQIYNYFTPTQQAQLGFCLDLCHVFVAGAMDVRRPASVHVFFQRFNELIGLDKLKVIHFNDSKIKFDGHNDSHEQLLMGFIGKAELGGSSQGFREVVKLAKQHQIPLVLETPGDPSHQVQLLDAWWQADSSADLVEQGYLDYYREHAPKVRRP